MQIYLPIAELPISILTVLGLSGAVGFISGLFGVGGGFLLTPLLIFLDIPPAVAVATVALPTAALAQASAPAAAASAAPAEAVPATAAAPAATAAATRSDVP